MLGSILGIGDQRAHEDDARGPVLYREETYSFRSGHCAEPGLGLGVTTELSSRRHCIVKQNLHGLGCPLSKGPMVFRAVGLEGRDFRSAAERGGTLSFPKGHSKCLTWRWSEGQDHFSGSTGPCPSVRHFPGFSATTEG